MNAKKKRDLEKLLRDERKQDKERVTEGDEFKGKEVFVTGAYRKQLEETVKFREELEKTDRIDGGLFNNETGLLTKIILSLIYAYQDSYNLEFLIP
jgi:hypothetical protein